jgi:hypothetical protein
MISPWDGSRSNFENIDKTKYISEMENVQHNINIMKQPLSQTFKKISGFVCHTFRLDQIQFRLQPG